MFAFERKIALRYALPGRSRGISGLLSLISLAGLTLSVFGLIVVMSVMNGFERELQDRMLRLLPHARVLLSAEDSQRWSELASRLGDQRDIVAVSPYIQASVIFRRQQDIVPATLQAIAADESVLSDNISAAMRNGSLSALNETPFSVVLGSQLARKLGVSVGDSLTVVIPRVHISPVGPVIRERRLQVVGLFEVGAELDASMALTTLATARKLIPGKRAVDGLRLESNDRYAIEQILDRAVSQLEPDIAALISQRQSWRDENAVLYAAVVMEKLMIFVLLLCVVAVASFSIVAIVLMNVLDKQTQIAILRTMGASRAVVRRAFLLQGLLIGVVGTGLGVGLALLVAPNLGAIMGGFESLLGWQLFDPSVYYIAYLPTQLRYTDVVVVSSLAILISLLVSLFPAARAAEVDPVRALSAVH